MFGAVSVRCAAGVTTCWPGPLSVTMAEFEATPTTRKGIAIAKCVANCIANSPKYQLSAAHHLPPLSHRRDIPSRSGRKVSDTGVLVASVRDRLDVAAFAAEDDVALPAVALAEYLTGIELDNNPGAAGRPSGVPR